MFGPRQNREAVDLPPHQPQKIRFTIVIAVGRARGFYFRGGGRAPPFAVVPLPFPCDLNHICNCSPPRQVLHAHDGEAARKENHLNEPKGWAKDKSERPREG